MSRFTPDTLTPEEIQIAVRQALPDARVESIASVLTRTESVSYDLRLSDHMDVTLEVYTGPQADVDVEYETRLLGLLTSETGVPTPRVLHKGDSLADTHCPWALLTCIPGQALSLVADLLDDGEMETIGYETGRYLSHLHQLALDEFGSLFDRGPHDHPREKAYVLAQAGEWLAICIQDAMLPEEAAAAFRRHLTGTDLLDRPQACLIHGDLGPEKLMVEEGGSGYHVTGIFGFRQARGGSPEFDIAALFFWPTTKAPSFRKGFLDGYVEGGDLPVRFWERLALYEAAFCLSKVASSHQSSVEMIQACKRRFVDYTKKLSELW